MALALAAGMAAGFVFFGPAWHVIERPLCAAAIRGHSGCHTLGVDQLVLNGPLDAFYLRVKVALIAGVILSPPIWLYQIWAFAAPGLHARENGGAVSSWVRRSPCSASVSRCATCRWAGPCTTYSA
jgi:sec-independent protein translocase protein TatC